MASIRLRGATWRAELYKDGVRESASFATKRLAVAWAQQREAELVGARLPDHTVREALQRFAKEVSPKHRGERWEITRLRLLERDKLADVHLPALRPIHVAEWRERRLAQVSGASVRREMNLLQSVFKACRKDWGWLSTDPVADVDRPANPPSRRRRISQDEIDRVTLALGYDGGAPQTVSDRVALAFLFALETAMRSGEILGLTWKDVAPKSVTLPRTKNGDIRRVPLSPRAREIITLLPPGGDTVFQVDGPSKDALFRRARDAAKIEDLHFHDSRAEAIWRLSKKLDVMELARMIGHRDLKSLLLYYNADPDELADRL
ncbi:tyrosine-type recombinase/integrase [Xanthomonas translucens]|uniref:tyrosine-type recombinase/integrase n=1 Tax=Xanthomonas campestris pv. translucens TaxID=343 RepID=UPI00071E72A4|nr:site-specific integrase [Xanthomonas translucens]QEN93665.1 site-specific integrase [Xanthomonas translucens pv. undulosa]QSQ58020.1 site-specific integrase [Xanthomonas translucens pv. undulosa]UPU47732.1 site-specific integrase [Xanthomonas translucens pv. undulosa]WLA02830.1 site-specific integrase [Xanthomonas translucens]WLA06580.1 site-specific integrase [Xanthomonas translucens]